MDVSRRRFLVGAAWPRPSFSGDRVRALGDGKPSR